MESGERGMGSGRELGDGVRREWRMGSGESGGWSQERVGDGVRREWGMGSGESGETSVRDIVGAQGKEATVFCRKGY